MSRIGLLFAGQGAQKLGMGKEIYENFHQAREVFQEASTTLGLDLKRMIFDGDDQTLMKTENTQPCVLTVSVAISVVLKNCGLKADIVAGLSLGEYSAHVYSESITFADAVAVVAKRGKFMQEEVPLGIGSMIVIIGLETSLVQEICLQAKAFGSIELSNFNCPGQITLSGEMAALDRACELAKESGAKRAMPLPVSAPFHCNMLKGAGDKLALELETVQISDMQVPVVSNVTGDYIKSKDEIKDFLVRQVYSPVLFESVVRRMIADGVDVFIEIGPGKALSGFARKINKDIDLFNVENVVDLKKVLKGLGL